MGHSLKVFSPSVGGTGFMLTSMERDVLPEKAYPSIVVTLSGSVTLWRS
jgi:hypothetical protein